MTDVYLVIFSIATITFLIRITGVWLGQRLPQTGPWSRALNALPGTLIISLVAVLLASGGPTEWIAAGVAAAVALVTNNLPLTMAAAIACVYGLRHGLGM